MANKGKELLEEFMRMPERVRELWFEWLRNDTFNGLTDAESYAVTNGFYSEGCKSPIEQIFLFAYDANYFMKGAKDDFYEGMYLETQYVIEIGKKKYYADFLLHHDFADWGKSKSLVIECDGHDFHEKTKEQVEHDNERSLDIKKAGYDIIRFSGSQIYKNPYKCVNEAINYFKSITTLVEGAGYPHD